MQHLLRPPSRASQQPRRLAPQNHRGPFPMADRIQIYTVHTKSPVVSDSRRSTLDSAFKHSHTATLKADPSKEKKKATTGKQETGHLPKAPHHPPEPHRRRASVASAILLLLSLFFFCCCCCPSLPGLGTQWSSKCSSPSRPMYCQGTRLRVAARTVQHGDDGPLPHGIRGYLEPLCATF